MTYNDFYKYNYVNGVKNVAHKYRFLLLVNINFERGKMKARYLRIDKQKNKNLI